jgi:hypothetical protein
MKGEREMTDETKHYKPRYSSDCTAGFPDDYFSEDYYEEEKETEKCTLKS